MRSDTQFPLLSALGLYIMQTLGDGNCLFRALADQLHGTPDQHQEVRATVIEHIRNHESYYKKFVGVFPGGGTRRNPKRKNTAATAPTDTSTPSEADIDRAFQEHLRKMARGGEWGDNMEITAFCGAYNVNVKIYQQDFAYFASPPHDLLEDDLTDRPVMHIAYHGPSHEHYSSVRNLDGPHSGLPHIKVEALTPEEEKARQANLPVLTTIEPYMIKAVTDNLPFLIDNRQVKQLLEQTNGDVASAVNFLIAAEDGFTSPSGQESSSIERDADSDDEHLLGPNKRRDRRSSRAARSILKSTSPDNRSRRLARSSSRASRSVLKSTSPTIKKAKESSRERRARMMKIATDWSGESDSVPDTDDDSWHTESSWRGNRSASASPVRPPHSDSSLPIIKTEQNDSSQSSTEYKGPTRVKIVWKGKAEQMASNKSKVRQSGPQRRVPARDKRDIKKQAQKAARRQRAIAEAKELAIGSTGQNDLPILTKAKKASPELDSAFQVFKI